MKLSSVLATAAVATAAPWNPSNNWSSSPIPGYPAGIPWCLNDGQAKFLVDKFAFVLSNPDRAAGNATGQVLLVDNFVETSDSIDILAGLPLGSSAATSKQQYLNGILNAPPIPGFTTLDIFHDCTKISWRWNVASLGSAIYPVKGINEFEVNPKTGQLKTLNLEFNSIAWGTDLGWKCTAPARGGPPS